MALVSLRQMLDHAADNGYGVPVEAFGCAGQAARIKPVPLEKMAARYA